MGTDDRYTRFALERVKAAPLTSGDMLHWDGLGSVSRSLRLIPAAELVTCMDELVAPATAGQRVSPVRSALPLTLIPSLPVPVIDWAAEALRLTFYLDPVLLLSPRPGLSPRVTGTLIWVHGKEPDEGDPPSPRPALLVEAPDAIPQGRRVELVFHLFPNDPLLQHMATVLRNAVEATGDIEQLYAEVLADALVAHCFSRYRAVQPVRVEVNNRLTPYTLQRTLAYIEAHLDQKLSLATLAAVAQMSLSHFAHLFKHSTGLAPHKYVSQSRMAHARQLLAETDMPLIEIAQQVGCADSSHFAALFRTHTALTPKAYRNATRQA